MSSHAKNLNYHATLHKLYTWFDINININIYLNRAKISSIGGNEAPAPYKYAHGLLSQLLSIKVTVVASCSFYIKCSMLDDALLKCVVTEVILFSVVVFKTLTLWWDL